MKSIKYVDYTKSHRQGDRTLHPIIKMRVRGYNKILNPPRYSSRLKQQPKTEFHFDD